MLTGTDAVMVFALPALCPISALTGADAVMVFALPALCPISALTGTDAATAFADVVVRMETLTGSVLDTISLPGSGTKVSVVT